MQFFKFSDYVLNLAQVSDIDQEDPKSWVVWMASGRQYTLDGDDLKAFRKATGL